jgi:hypothetical protein
MMQDANEFGWIVCVLVRLNLRSGIKCLIDVFVNLGAIHINKLKRYAYMMTDVSGFSW